MQFFQSIFYLFIVLSSSFFSQTFGQVEVEIKEVGLWKHSKTMAFTYVGALELNAKDGVFLASVSDVDTDSLQQLYVCDRLDHCIKVFDEKGKFIRIIGTRGKGPGELLTPNNVTIASDGLVYVSQSSQRKISVFKPDGTFLKDIATPNFMVEDMSISPSNQYLYFTPVAPMYHLPKKNPIPSIYILDLTRDKWTKMGELAFIGKTSKGYQTAATSMISCNKSGEIFYATGYPYEIKIYGSSGLLKESITKTENIAKPEIFEIRTGLKILIPRTDIRKIILLPNGDFLVAVVDLGENYLKFFSKSKATHLSLREISLWYDVYSSKGEFLQSFTVANPLEMGLIMHCDDKNNVYTFIPEWEVPSVKKYLLTFVTKSNKD